MKHRIPLYGFMLLTYLVLLYPACKSKDVCEGMRTDYFSYIQDSMRDDLYCGIPGMLNFKELGTGEVESFSFQGNCKTSWLEGKPGWEYPCNASIHLEKFGHYFWGERSLLELFYCCRQINGAVQIRYEFFAFERPFIGEPGLSIGQLPKVDLLMDGKEYKQVSLMVGSSPWGNDTLWYRSDLCVLKAHISMTGNRYERQF